MNAVTDRALDAGLFRQIAEASRDWESWLMPDGTLRWVSPAVARVTGYSVEECFAMSDYPQALVLAEDMPTFAVFEQAVAARTAGDNLTVRLRRKDGAVTWVALSWMPFFDPHGEYLGIRTSVRDLSQRFPNAYFDGLRPAASRLMHEVMDVAGGIDRAYQLVTECAARTLDVARVGVWLFEEGRLVCVDLYVLEDNAHIVSAAIPFANCPRYIEAISSDQLVIASDALQDGVTSELVDAYLKPYGIRAMLDVPILRGGRTIGVLCHEHVGNVRHWSRSELAFAERLSEALTLALESNERLRLQEKTRQLASVVELAPIMVGILTPAFKPIYFNQTVTDVLYEGADWSAPDFEPGQIFPAEALQRFQEVTVPTALRVGHWSGETSLTTVGGENIPVWQTLVAHRDAKGEVQYFSSISRDLREQKQLEARTRQLASIVEAMPDMVATAAFTSAELGDAVAPTDVFRNKPLYLNRAGILMLSGGRRTDIPDFVFSDAFSREVLQLLNEVVLPTALRDGVWWGETRMQTLAGEAFPVWLTVIAHRNGNNAVTYLSFVVHDLREQRHLEEQTQRLASIIEATPDAVLTVGLDGAPVYLNRAARRAQEPVDDQHIAEFGTVNIAAAYSPEAMQFRNEVVVPTALREGYWSGEIRLLTVAGEEIPVWQTMVVHREGDGSVKYLSSILHDLRGQKQIEAQLRERENALQQLNAELEARIAERTQKVEEVNRNLEAFAYSVAHDLKAPLRGIDGYARLLLEDYGAQLPGEAPDFVDNICNAADRMHQLIDDLLSYSRVGRRDLAPTNFSLRLVMERILAERQHEVEMRGMHFINQLGDITLSADLDCFILLLRNLVDNAIKFSRDAATPEVTVSAAQDATHTLIEVHDNGCGFDMKYHDRIFSIFQRLHRVEDYPGTGVGLAIVSKSAERMGGRVWARSEPGKGASFYVELPR